MNDYNTIETSIYNEVWHGFFSEIGSQMQLAEEIMVLKAERGTNTRGKAMPAFGCRVPLKTAL